MSRYPAIFQNGNKAFVPFLMVGDPTPGAFQDIVDTAIEAGADALELGVPFSDPIADGPTIQRSHIRAAKSGTNTFNSFEQIAKVRKRHPSIPIGLLMYSNIVDALGADNFYAHVSDAGADSVLIADVPVREGATYATKAQEHGVDPIFIAPPNATRAALQQIAHMSRGYVYAVSRAGVTGTETVASTTGLGSNVDLLAQYGAPPSLLGFGISKSEHVRAAVENGAAGAISGSAIVSIIERLADKPKLLHSELKAFIEPMKAATR